MCLLETISNYPYWENKRKREEAIGSHKLSQKEKKKRRENDWLQYIKLATTMNGRHHATFILTHVLLPDVGLLQLMIGDR